MYSYSSATFDTDGAKEFFMNKISYTLGPADLKQMLKNDLERFNLIDLRKYEDYIAGHIPYAMHIPVEQIEDHWNMFDREKINIVYCYNPFCHLAAKYARLIAEKGYPVMELCGGYHAWKEFFNFETVSDDTAQNRE